MFSAFLGLQLFSAHLEHLSKRRKRQVVTKWMLLNSKCLDKLVLHNKFGLSVVRFALSFCLQCSKWGEKGCCQHFSACEPNN